MLDRLGLSVGQRAVKEENAAEGLESSSTRLLDTEVLLLAVSERPALTDNHLTLGEGTGLVTADVRDTTERLESVETTNDDIALGHTLGTDTEGDGENGDKGLGDDTDTEGDGIQDDLVVDVELGDTKDNDGKMMARNKST